MRVSIVNCVSTAAKMMEFSDTSLLANSGHNKFDYVIVKWLATLEVDQYLAYLSSAVRLRYPGCRVHIVEHKTDLNVGYVPNLRAMMNDGFSAGFELNEYAGLVNTDCYFGRGWLRNLVKHVRPDYVVNSLHITAASAPNPVRGIITEDLGVPGVETFNKKRFEELYLAFYREDLIRSEDTAGLNGYRECATMPYLFHRQYWESCGPWELECTDKQSPDVRFFDRVNEAGAVFALSESSIVYHHEAVERKGKRPVGAEQLEEE